MTGKKAKKKTRGYRERNGYVQEQSYALPSYPKVLEAAERAEGAFQSWHFMEARPSNGGSFTETVIVDEPHGTRAYQSKTTMHFWSGRYVPEHGVFEIDANDATFYGHPAGTPLFVDLTGESVSQAELDAEAAAREENGD